MRSPGILINLTLEHCVPFIGIHNVNIDYLRPQPASSLFVAGETGETGEYMFNSSEGLTMSNADPADVAPITGNAAEHSQEYKPARYVTVTGATAPDGMPYVHFQPKYVEHPGVWVSLMELSNQQAPERLRARGIFLFGDDLKWAIEEAQKVRSFPPMPLIALPGSTAGYFSLIAGDVFSPKGSDPATILFDPRPTKCGKKGKLKLWKLGVARLAARQNLLTFVLMIPFAGPLLKLSRIHENFGFELCGPGGTGKTSAQHLAASVFGGALEPGGANYWIAANTTINGLEQLYAEHADLAMIIDEMGDFCNGETERVRATKTREMIFRLRSGTTKNRFDGRREEPTRFVYLTSTNVSLGNLLSDLDCATSAAAKYRLLTIPIGKTRKHGIFDYLPEGCVNGSEAISQLQVLVLNHHGLAIRRYLKRFVKERAGGEDALRQKIDAGIRRFRDAVGVDEDVGSEARVADAFGLIYVAGQLAITYGALPKELDPLKAAIEVYRLNREATAPLPTHHQLLERLVHNPRSLRIDSNALRSIPDDELNRAPALVRSTYSGELELLLTSRQLARRFESKAAFYRDPEVARVAIIDKDSRKTVKRTVRTEARQERFHAFRLDRKADDADSQEAESLDF